MTLTEFRTKAYELLSANGCEIIGDTMYFPESSVMNMLEWMIENTGDLPLSEADIAKQIIESINRSFLKITGTVE